MQEEVKKLPNLELREITFLLGQKNTNKQELNEKLLSIIKENGKL